MSVSVTVIHPESAKRQLICDWLREAGYAAWEASNPEEALSRLLSRSTRIAVVGVEFLKGGGTCLLERLTATSPIVHKIVIGDIPSLALLADCLEHGVDEFVPEPVGDAGLLLEAVRLACARIERWYEAARRIAPEIKEDELRDHLDEVPVE